MYKIKQTFTYPAAIKYHIYLDGTVWTMCNNLDEAIRLILDAAFNDTPDEYKQDVIRFYELLARSSFYMNNDFKATDYSSPDPLNVLRQAMMLKQRLLEYYQGELKYPPIRMQELKEFFDNIQELTLVLKKK